MAKFYPKWVSFNTDLNSMVNPSPPSQGYFEVLVNVFDMPQNCTIEVQITVILLDARLVLKHVIEISMNRTGDSLA